MTSTALIGLGANLDNPRAQLERAIEALDQLPLTHCTRHSRLYASKPVGPQDQPDYVNAVAELHTRLSPLALLDQLQALEQQHRRVRLRHWGPRTLDLDLLLFDDRAIIMPRLVVPHPEMLNRGFVMRPLADLLGSRTFMSLSNEDLETLAQQVEGDDLLPLGPQE
ncbi:MULTISPECIES: 2-amino-4-hydroxy-6-hydroxymethyldihydropteridine diphosphokinase [Cobetia]|uniref:2-amino-4-hydroxy-6-hydroxymethyldihydropteridine pyrophosphokinase n=1 Tax=Cobetia crustatorum TaxID=553385 RepID=A0A558HSM9_9GAMM|nr:MULTISPECIES: 2-amino-4-hydroxy-6-hydroxymethyldihydropteridine diphosphokinase [Cobetia]TVU72091.1 2-amino-4-hydroxy-6-hydroxymethyldihydropteridine diphosphokinase [Cobetia crustatorum]